MASVLDWLPQSAGPVRVCAGWPGSNGSMMSTNAGAVVASLKLGRGDALLVADPVLLLEDEPLLLQPAKAKPTRAAGAALWGAPPGLRLEAEPLLLQPAKAKPIRAANTAARPRYRLCIRPC